MPNHHRRSVVRDRIVDAEVIKLELREARLRAARRRETPARDAARPPARERGRAASR